MKKWRKYSKNRLLFFNQETLPIKFLTSFVKLTKQENCTQHHQATSTALHKTCITNNKSICNTCFPEMKKMCSLEKIK